MTDEELEHRLTDVESRSKSNTIVWMTLKG